MSQDRQTCLWTDY